MLSIIRPPVVRRACAGLIGALALAGAAAPAAAAGLTVADAVARALRDGPEAKIARLEAGEATDTASAARSIYWPQASVSSQAGWSNRQNDTLDALDGDFVVKEYPLSSLGSNEAWLSVVIDQMLFDLRGWRVVERSELEAEVAAVAEAQQRETISYAVLERYVTVLRLEQLAALDAQRLRDAEWLDRQAGVLLESGRTLPAEREQVALALDEARLANASRAQELEDARAALARAIGDAGGDALAPLAADSLPVPAPPADLETDAALRGAPELRILALRRRMEDLTVAAERAGRLPTLSVRGGYFHYGTKRFDSFEDEVAVGVDLKIPVFDGFKTSSNIDGATKAAEAARLRYDMARDSKRARVRDLLRRLAATAQQPALAARRAEISRERLRLADLSLQGQRGTLAQALAVRSDAARDGQSAVDARADRVLLWATLQRELGGLAAALGSAAPAAEGAAEETP